jgi:hypothetical protein
MLLIFLSTLESCESSALIVSSPGIVGPEVTVPSMRPPTAPPAGLPDVPTVVEPMGPDEVPPLDVDPEELAVPAELVPGALESLAALPAPLGSLPELFSPPTLPGPVTPLTDDVPAPAEPALGAAPVAPDAPPAEAPPADAPPEDPPLPPPPLPPPLCATVETGYSRAATSSNLQGNDWAIRKTPFDLNALEKSAFRKEERISGVRLEA